MEWSYYIYSEHVIGTLSQTNVTIEPSGAFFLQLHWKSTDAAQNQESITKKKKKKKR